MAASVKLPEFWPEDPELWFVRVNAVFTTHNINSDTSKFHHIVAKLDATAASEVRATLTNPPEVNRYETLKGELIKAFGKTQAQKDHQLLNLNGLGDRKPSALLRRIEALNADPTTLKRALFMANLPAEVRSILASQTFESLAALAEAADRIIESRDMTAQQRLNALHLDDNSLLMPTGPAAPTQPDEHELDILALQRQRNPRLKERRLRTHDQKSDSFICHYHSRFGPDARRCQPQCIFSSLVKPTSSAVPGNGPAGR